MAKKKAATKATTKDSTEIQASFDDIINASVSNIHSKNTVNPRDKYISKQIDKKGNKRE